MKQTAIYLTLILSGTFSQADNHWLKKKMHFERHSKEFYQRRANKLKAKTKYIQNEQKSNLKKSQLKRTFLENRMQTDNRNKAQELLNLFVHPNKNNKKDVKRKFIRRW